MRSWLYHIDVFHALFWCCFQGSVSEDFLVQQYYCSGVKDTLVLGFTFLAKLHEQHPTERAFCCQLLKRNTGKHVNLV